MSMFTTFIYCVLWELFSTLVPQRKSIGRRLYKNLGCYYKAVIARNKSNCRKHNLGFRLTTIMISRLLLYIKCDINVYHVDNCIDCLLYYMTMTTLGILYLIYYLQKCTKRNLNSDNLFVCLFLSLSIDICRCVYMYI